MQRAVWIWLFALLVLTVDPVLAQVGSEVKTNIETTGESEVRIHIENEVQSTSTENVEIERRIETNINGEKSVYESSTAGKKVIDINRKLKPESNNSNSQQKNRQRQKEQNRRPQPQNRFEAWTREFEKRLESWIRSLSNVFQEN